MRLVYRLKFPWTGKLGHLDHVTIPCHDARIAEEFYVGLLRAQVVNRIDRALLRRIGWNDLDITQNAAEHLSVTLAGGPRLDLFVYPPGSPAGSAPMHPHFALTVAQDSFCAGRGVLRNTAWSWRVPRDPVLPDRLPSTSTIHSEIIWRSSLSDSLRAICRLGFRTARG
jgi:catechol 2,3-dioxygenase-like lactoylglutathione lyase family enzyme